MTPHESPHPRLGRLALALGARALAGAARGYARLALRPSALDDGARAWLRLHARECGALEGDAESWVECESAALRDASLDSPALEALAAAHAAAVAPLPRPEVMAVLNATPDSFSDGGRHLEPDTAIEAGLRFLAEGATWLDVGGESTRPGARPVAVPEELGRILPIVAGLAAQGCTRISIDTRRAEVAEAALDAGATLVNDVGAGLDDPRMLEVVAAAGCGYALMHRQGAPETMQVAPSYGDAVADVAEFLRVRAAACLDAGISEERLFIDPGIGFGKQLEHNLDLLRRLGELRSIGLPLLVGPSRKSFIGHVTGGQQPGDWRAAALRDTPEERIGGTAAAITFCVAGGARVVRVHDVAVMAEACALAEALRERPPLPEIVPCS